MSDEPTTCGHLKREHRPSPGGGGRFSGQVHDEPRHKVSVLYQSLIGHELIMAEVHLNELLVLVREPLLHLVRLVRLVRGNKGTSR